MADDVVRRNVLKGLGGLAVAGAAGFKLNRAIAAAALNAHVSVTPAVANRARLLSDRVVGYAQKSVAVGDTIDFRVSSPSPYQLSVRRLGWNTDMASDLDWPMQTFGVAPASTRTIHPGSYIHVEKALASSGPYPQLTLECWVRVFASTTWRGLITQHTYASQCGYGLFIDDNGRPYAYFGTGGGYNAAWALSGQTAIPSSPTGLPSAWYHLAAVFDNGVAKLYVNGVLEAQAAGFPQAVVPGTAPLRIGAYGDDAGTAYFLNGDVAMPSIYARALSAQDIQARFNESKITQPSDTALIGCWPLTEEGGFVVGDVSGYAREGLVVNHGAWMIGGPRFDGLSVRRDDPNYDPIADDKRGNSLRLGDSDLFECDWPITQSYSLPIDAIPGVYVGRVSVDGVRRYDITFIVRADAARRAKVMVVCATNTWLAYRFEFELAGLYHGSRASGADSGQSQYYVGLNMPWTSADPYVLYYYFEADEVEGSPEYRYSHMLRAERFMHVWFERMGIHYDVIGDQDLDSNPGILEGYKTVVICGHSEYWSNKAYDGVKDYLASGGTVISASGNTMCWRVTYIDGMMECRRKPPGAGNVLFGEHYHEFDRISGGPMREVDRAAWKLTGLDTAGYKRDDLFPEGSGGYEVGFSPYKVVAPSHPFFTAPEPISVSVGEEIGGKYAVGHEYDVTLDELPVTGSVPRPPIPAEYAPIVLASASSAVGEYGLLGPKLDYGIEFTQEVGVMSQIIDWQPPTGGRVFSIGSINAGQSLNDDARMSTLLRNALYHFGVEHILSVLAVGRDGGLKNKWFANGAWWPSASEWQDLGGDFGDGSPVGVQGSSDTISIMGISPTNALQYRYWSGDDDWSAWVDMGLSCKGSPALASSGRNQLDIFVRGFDNRIHRKTWDGASWNNWADMGGVAASDPVAVACHGRESSVAFLGTAGKVFYKFKAQNAYPAQWADMGGQFAHGPSMFWWAGKLYVFAVDAVGHLHVKHWNGGQWLPSLTGWRDLGGTLSGRVHIASTGPLELAVFGVGVDGRLKVMYLRDTDPMSPEATAWSDLGGSLIGEPSAHSFRGSHVSVVATGVDGRIHHRLWNGSSWSAWQDLGGDMAPSPSIYRWLRF